MKVSRIASILLSLAMGCGGGGSDSPDVGVLDLTNGGNQSRVGDCHQQWSVQPVGGGETLFANTGPCGDFAFTLKPGPYNVTACSPGGACSGSDCFVQTVNVIEGQRTPLNVQCMACSPCS